MKKCVLCKVVTFLAGVGALNWLLITYGNVNLVSYFLGDMTPAAKTVYTLIGISGLLIIISMLKACPCIGKSATCK